MTRRARRLLAGPPATAPGTAPEPSAPPEPVDPTRVREDELLRTVPGLARLDDRIAVVRDDLTPVRALEAMLTDVATALRAAQLPYVLVPDPRPQYRLAIRPGDRAAVLATCADAFHGRPVYADLLGHGRTLGSVLAEHLPQAVAEWEQVGEPTGDTGAERPERVKGIRLYLPVVTSRGSLCYGPEQGCDLEFWDAAAEGVVAAISETPFGWWVPSLEAAGTIRIGGLDHPVAEAFSRSFPDDVDFPVDAVITWVDDADPAWRQRRAAARSGAPDQPPGRADDEDHRYHSRDELRYCLRSIAMYAPWIRRIFVVTDRQIPDWLDTTTIGLTVVFHSVLFRSDDVAPVFNSHAIESRLHRIPGLAEHFLYFNDDMFLGRAVRPQDFFLGNGLPLFFRDSRVIPPGDPDTATDVYVAAQQTTRALVERECGRTFTQVLSHVPYPLRRSLLAEAAGRWPEEFARTSRSVFRAATDIAPVTLATYYGYLTGRTVGGRIGHEYVRTDHADGLERLAGLLDGRAAQVLCLADGDGTDLPRAEQDRAVVRFLQAYFPVAGPYELTPPEEPDECGPLDRPAVRT